MPQPIQMLHRFDRGRSVVDLHARDAELRNEAG
jgi:hypothetical protein